MFRTLTLGISALSLLATPIAAAAKDREEGRGSKHEAKHEAKHELKQERRELREARKYGDRRDVYEQRRDVQEARNELRSDRQDRRDWRTYRNYDYNRPARGYNAYYADQYYRDGRYYQPRRLSSSDRIYRGRDNRYYCRRSDGTTGLIIGAIGGGLLGNALESGRSNTLGIVLGAIGGGALGRSIDRNNVQCR